MSCAAQLTCFLELSGIEALGRVCLGLVDVPFDDIQWLDSMVEWTQCVAMGFK